MPAMECKKENHLKKCNCSYEPCPRKGICCECVEYHRRQDELPACYFSVKTERTFDRSFRRFLQDQK